MTALPATPLSAHMSTGRLYRHAPLREAGRAKARRAWWDSYSTRLAKQADMVRYLDALTMPASGLWAYARVPKTGTNSVLAALHHLEFDAPLTTEVNETNNTAEDNAPHLLDEAGVFMAPLQTTHDPQTLDRAFRFTVLRHPANRARSSFAYLCLSHRLRRRHLAPARLRMTALTGFDWAQDPARKSGFDKFLDFVEDSLAVSRLKLDRHLAPQVYTLPRALFGPHLTGRTEEMGAFLRKLAASFGTVLPDTIAEQRRNSTPHGQSTPNLSQDQRRRCETLFADDMDWYETI